MAATACEIANFHLAKTLLDYAGISEKFAVDTARGMSRISCHIKSKKILAMLREQGHENPRMYVKITNQKYETSLINYHTKCAIVYRSMGYTAENTSKTFDTFEELEQEFILFGIVPYSYLKPAT